jgi:hypothetical protein
MVHIAPIWHTFEQHRFYQTTFYFKRHCVGVFTLYWNKHCLFMIVQYTDTTMCTVQLHCELCLYLYSLDRVHTVTLQDELLYRDICKYTYSALQQSSYIIMNLYIIIVINAFFCICGVCNELHRAGITHLLLGACNRRSF